MIAALLVAALPACFYFESINQRPSIAIVRVTETSITRASALDLRAVVRDSGGDSVALTWRAYRCGATLADCDDQPYDDGAGVAFRTQVPVRTSAQQLVQHVRVELEGTDSRGAVADPAQVLELDVFNAPPALEAPIALGGKVVGASVEWRARFLDPDGDTDKVAVSWQLTGPGVGAVRLLGGGQEPDRYRFDRAEQTAAALGHWTMMVRATDEAGATAVASSQIDIAADLPPCLTTLAPVTAAPLLFDQARRFAVLRVSDDLDPYPPRPGEPGPRFAWSLLAPSRGGMRVVLTGATGNAVELDPATFVPGEVLQLRVEIGDREDRAPAPGCVDSSDSCSIQQTPCTQRQTWRLEVR
jgi:hypothetical protein